jgi:hypothetical protein
MLNDHVNIHLCFYIEREDLGRFGLTSKYFHSIVHCDALWRRLLQSDLELKTKENPPGFRANDVGIEDVQTISFYSLFLRWRVHFSGYSWELICLSRKWWHHMETYLIQHGMIDLYNTLNGPASEAEINKVDEDLRRTTAGIRPGKSIPNCLRILYRFHNGQNLALNDVRLRTSRAQEMLQMLSTTNCRETGKSLLEKQSMMGLFGGAAFYDTICVNTLLPLKFFARAREMTFHKDNSRRLVMYVDRDTEEVLPNTDRYMAAEDGSSSSFSDEYGPVWLGPQDVVIFSINTSTWADIEGCHKVFLVDSVDHKTGEQAGDVFTNLSSDGASGATFLQCVDYAGLKTKKNDTGDSSVVTHSRHSNIKGVRGSLFDWLFEYLRRLESGIIRVESLAREDKESISPLSMITHFQSPPEASCLPNKSILPEIYKLPSSRLQLIGEGNLSKPLEGTNNSLMGHSHVNSDGLELTLCPYFLPCLCNESYGENSMWWTYSIRIRLLENISTVSSRYYHFDFSNSDDWNWDHDDASFYQYQGELKACKLTKRRWVITENCSLEIESSGEVVEGDGVIGLYPELVRGADEIRSGEILSVDQHFAYQSLNRSPSCSVDFDGHLVFQERSKFLVQAEKNIISKIHKTRFNVPSFIF